jgi:hypothetical protein
MSDWQPGDPLFQPHGIWHLPIFQLKDSVEFDVSASWPEPFAHNNLDDYETP